ncbi:MAG: Flp pilus assembly complex ATPase component TadA [Deltaproteobacteria bacterium]|nr:Flp pilus assembly complex ATPase component TadA [Deltaproteobacteria bacterium]
MTTPNRITVPALTQMLLKGGLIEAEAAREITSSERTLADAISKERSAMYSRLGLTGEAARPSPVDIVAHLNLQIPAQPGKYLNEDRIAQFLAETYKIPYKKIIPLELDPNFVTTQLPKAYAQRHMVIPLSNDNGVTVVAIPDPAALPVLQELEQRLSRKFRPVISSRSDILKVISEFWGLRQSLEKAKHEFQGETVDLGNLESLFDLKAGSEIEANDRQIIRIVDYLFAYAIDQRASDIHYEPKRDRASIRLRIDGHLHEVVQLPRPVLNAIVSHIKTRARLDIAEKRRPQDGRTKVSHYGREVEMRVSIVPVAFGEKLVIRLLNASAYLQPLDSLGFFPRDLVQFRSMLASANGLVLVTGPTGSGKTTTLYSGLKEVSRPDLSITTIEDPIEMVIEEFNQIAVNPKIELSFADALRVVLRQDPDIIMVGEIRDPETAQAAIQAALTGHLVLATLHTNDAPTAVTRLLDLGVEDYLIASTVIGVVAQRLLRSVCNDCAEAASLTPEQMEELKLPAKGMPPLPVKKAIGCPACRYSGYQGRAGIYEVMPMTDKIRKLVRTNPDVVEIRKSSIDDGMITLREAAVKKLAMGVTTFEEVLRATV